MCNLLKMMIAGFFLTILVACSTSPNGESTGEYFDSSATTTKVKASLVDQLGTAGFVIKVKTFKDQVQLSGFVDTLRIKQQAGAIASGVEGVKSIRNDIIVKS